MEPMQRKVVPQQSKSEEKVLKRGTLLFAVVLHGVSVMQPSFAKTQHAHRSVAKGEHASRAHSLAAKEKPGPTDTDNSRGAVNAPSPIGTTGGKAHAATVNSKSASPFQVRRVVVPAPAETRNSVGVAITPPRSATIGGEQTPKPTLPRPTSVPAESVDRAAIARPVVTASMPDRGKIDGTSLIRPSVAPTGLGGPVKPLAGINGTTFRQKR
jgi:hypothetical protein